MAITSTVAVAPLVVPLTTNIFELSTLHSTTLYVLMCGASWCKPCKLLYPYFVDCSINYPSAAFYYGDIDNDSLSDIINTLNPKKIPVCYFLKNGTLLDTFIGGNHDTLDSLINQYL